MIADPKRTRDNISVTLETGGRRLSQGEEDIAHDSGAADAGRGDNVEDAVDIMAKVFLRGQQQLSDNCQTTARKYFAHAPSHPVCVKVLGLL